MASKQFQAYFLPLGGPEQKVRRGREQGDAGDDLGVDRTRLGEEPERKHPRHRSSVCQVRSFYLRLFAGLSC